MVNQATVNWLHERVKKASRQSKSIPPMGKAAIERWLADLTKAQLTDIEALIGKTSGYKWGRAPDPEFVTVVERVVAHYQFVDATHAEPSMTKEIRGQKSKEHLPNKTESPDGQGTKVKQADFSKDIIKKWLADEPTTNPNSTEHTEEKKIVPVRKTGATGPNLSVRDPTPTLYTPRDGVDTYFRDVNVQEETVKTIINKLRSIKTNTSTLHVLQSYIETLCFAEDMNITSFFLVNLHRSITSRKTNDNSTTVHVNLVSTRMADPLNAKWCKAPWYSCEWTSSFIWMLALPVTKIGSRMPDPHFPRNILEMFIPNTTLTTAFQHAKNLAVGPAKSSTIIHVSLIDTISRGPDGRSRYLQSQRRCFDFTHYFIIGVGPEGMRVWHSFRNYGPRLFEQISHGYSRIRNWEEALEYVADYEEFAASQGQGQTFNTRKGELYERLFGINLYTYVLRNTDIFGFASEFGARTEVNILENVTAEDIAKFNWYVDDQAPQNKYLSYDRAITKWIDLGTRNT